MIIKEQLSGEELPSVGRRSFPSHPDAGLPCAKNVREHDMQRSLRSEPLLAPTNCRNCGSSRLGHLFVSEGYPIDHCADCAFVQVRDEPHPEALDEVYRELHIRHATFRSDDAVRIENTRRLKLLQKLVPAGSSVLDAGCASGDFLVQAKHSFKMSGFDISPDAVEVAKKRNPEIADKLWSGRVEDILSRPERFDAIVMWDVIEHLWDPTSTCRALFEKLAPNGLLIISTPDSGALIARLMGKRWAFMMPPEHLSLFARKSFVTLFDRWKGVKIDYHRSLGKATNAAFLLYKFNRMVGNRIPKPFLDAIARSWAGGVMVYVPTRDIQYIAVRKLDGYQGDPMFNTVRE